MSDSMPGRSYSTPAMGTALPATWVMGPGGHKFEGEKLTGDNNFRVWKMHMELFIRVHHLIGYVHLSDDEPLDVSLDQRSDQAIFLFNQMISAISYDLMRLLMGSKTVAELWKSIMMRFEKRSPLKIGILYGKLQNLQLRSPENLHSYLQQFQILVTELKCVEDNVKEDQLALLLLRNIKVKDFQAPCAVLQSKPRESMLVDDFSTHLLEYVENAGYSFDASKPKILVKKERDEQALYAGDKEKGSYQVKQRFLGICYNCQRRGHMARDCRCPRRERVYRNSQDEKEDVQANMSLALTAVVDESHFWGEFIIDSGCTHHMTGSKKNLTNYKVFEKPRIISTFGGVKVQGIGSGSMEINHNGIILKLDEVIYVPGAIKNLFSCIAANNQGIKILFNLDHCAIIKDGKIIKLKLQSHGLYALSASEDGGNQNKTHRVDYMLLHRRLGHLNFNYMEELVKNQSVKNIELVGSKPERCEDCIESKFTVQPFHKCMFPIKATKVNELIHSDVVGPIAESIGGKRYFVLFIDDFSRYTQVYFLSKKSEVLSVFKHYKSFVEKHTGKSILRFRSDNGGEYSSNEFVEFLRKNGIKRETSVARRPQQNGVSERMNRTVIEMARTMRISAKLPLKFWAEAVNTAVYVRNRCSSRSLPKGSTPYTIWMGRKPSVDHFKVFGSQVWYKLDNAAKFDQQAKKGIFVGYASDRKAYRIFDESIQKLIISRDVKIVESKRISFVDQSYIQDPPIADKNVESESIVRRSGRISSRPARFSDEFASYLSVEMSDPANRVEAINSNKATEWEKAMKKEYDSLLKNDMWDIVSRPESKKVVDSRWVFKTKKDEYGNIAKYKARLVARGFTQVPGQDFEETFSPVVTKNSLRIIIAKAAKENLFLFQIDIETAYQHQKLKEEIFMEQPSGFEAAHTTSESHVCRLNRVLYGLKQGAVELHKHLKEQFHNFGYKINSHDECVFWKKQENDYIICAVYVDDILCACTTRNMFDQFREDLGSVFPVKDLGESKWLLGMFIEREREKGWIRLSQTSYVHVILNRFGMTECKPAKTPYSTEKFDHGQDEISNFPFRELIGHLMYLANMTRPDISQAVGYLSRFVSCFTSSHVLAVKHILRYLKGTSDFGITFRKDAKYQIQLFSDSDFAGDQVSRKLMTTTMTGRRSPRFGEQDACPHPVLDGQDWPVKGTRQDYLGGALI